MGTSTTPDRKKEKEPISKHFSSLGDKHLREE
jgi:hypothetical protein